MESLVETLTALALATLAPLLWRLRFAFRQTALAGAAIWFACAWASLLIVRIVTLRGGLTPGPAALAWYIAAVMALAPAIAVLGARWPTARVWSTFVVLPLAAVFLWPVAVGLLRGARFEHWVLEEPMALGYLLVLLMGTGNYVGSRWTFPALLWGAAWTLVVPALCPAFAAFVPSPETGRNLGCWLIVVAAWIIAGSVRHGRIADGAAVGLQQVWSDFRDLFGVVWSRRVQERFNEQAEKTGLAVRIGWNGLEDLSGNPLLSVQHDPAARTTDLAAAEQALRWFLQKFVESEWIDRRLAGRDDKRFSGNSSN